MPTNRNNNKGKEFAIGTKIEYNGKLYEVVKSDICSDCSLKGICPNNDIVKNNNSDNILSRDERINIFGECSCMNRTDDTSVIFKEILKTKEQDVYNVGPLYKTNNELMPILIDLPNGYVIDKEHSDFDKGIIAFKNKWLTLEQIYNMAKATNYHTYFSEIKDSTDDKSYTVREKLIAIANLMDIASYFNGGWEYHNNGNNCGYIIAYDKTKITDDGYQVIHINSDTDMYFGNIMFKNEVDAQYVIDNPNFREILDNIFKI